MSRQSALRSSGTIPRFSANVHRGPPVSSFNGQHPDDTTGQTESTNLDPASGPLKRRLGDVRSLLCLIILHVRSQDASGDNLFGTNAKLWIEYISSIVGVMLESRGCYVLPRLGRRSVYEHLDVIRERSFVSIECRETFARQEGQDTKNEGCD
jgi:hypothetical protein